MHDKDIAHILNEWQYEQGTLNVRMIEAANGRPLIQIRIELGIIQMELTDRPDGVLQDGFPTLLALFEDRGAWGGIDPEMCRRLREEGVQRSHRAAALFALGKWEEVILDCDTNLKLFDLCSENALEAHDRVALDQFRPAVLAMRARAGAEWAVDEGNPSAAVEAIDRGLAELRAILGEPWESSNEVQLLRGMKEALVPQLPPSERADLRERLAAAIAAENYELAAILRDELRLLRD
ncbi:MAG: UvrB/UvrC motif-containing protein [Phycisphaerales bacterium]|jgi:hypothetical protein|nr:UvrB/UvrC motif-containing protein [Phycisphaerales bacterium]